MVIAFASGFGLASASVSADTGLRVLCGAEAVWCKEMAAAYEKKTGTKVTVLRKSTSDVLAQIIAEKDDPKTDLWFGGTGDPHLQAAEQGLTLNYQSPKLPQLHDWARRQAEQSNYRTVGVYAGVLVIAYNAELLKKKRLRAPACWKDLVKPEYRDEIQIANPKSSGTAYTAIATFVQIMGEEPAFRYMKALHQNVEKYPSSGNDSVKAVARGEASISISFMHDAVTAAASGFPVKAVAPCEGTGYEIGSMSIIKGARHLEAAKALYEWLLTPEAQKLAAQTNQYSLPSNKSTPLPPEAPKFSGMKLIDYDIARFGRSKEHLRLLVRWEKEVSTPK